MNRTMTLPTTSCPSQTRRQPIGAARTLLSAGVLLALLAGCSTTQLAEPAKAVPVESRALDGAGSGTAGAGAATGAAPQSQVATVDLASRGAGGGSASGLPGQRVVYFDFDSFTIKDDYQPVIDGFARALQSGRDKRLVIEGHTDERGGREYNLALGQKRAAAVVRSLTLLGATESQLEAVSFGEERPAADGAEEAAWAKNRRAELKDR